MSEREQPPRDPEAGPELSRALDALRDLPAREAFRRELRARFLAGEQDAQRPLPRGEDAAPERPEAPLAPPARPARRTAPVPRRLRLLAGAALLTAAAAVLLVLRPWADRAPVWRLLEPAPGATLLVDERPIPTSRAAELLRSLGTANALETGETRVRLALDRRLVLDLAPRSRLVLVALPPAGSALPLRLALERGSLRVATGARFSGERLLVRSPDAEVEVVGTAFAVDVYPDATCVCCTEGEVRVEALDGGSAGGVRVAAGQLAWAVRGAELRLQDAVVPDHVAPLPELQALRR